MLSPTGRAPTAFHERSRWGRRDPYSVKEQPLDRDHDRDPSDWRNRCSPASCWRRARRSRRVQTPKRAESTHVAQAHGSAYVEHVRSGRPDPAERRRRTQGLANAFGRRASGEKHVAHEERVDTCLLIRRWGCQVPPWGKSSGGGPWACWIRRCARAPGLTSVRDPRVGSGAGDEMFDGVIPLGEALRPLDLSRPSTRVACRQQVFGSWPRRIGVSEGLTRAKGWRFVFGSSGLAGTGCHTARPKPGSSGQGIRTLVGSRRLGRR